MQSVFRDQAVKVSKNVDFNFVYNEGFDSICLASQNDTSKGINVHEPFSEYKQFLFCKLQHSKKNY